MSSPFLSNAERRRARQERLYEAAPKRGDAETVDMVGYLLEVMREDLMSGANVVSIAAARGHNGHGGRSLGSGRGRSGHRVSA